MTDLQFSDLQTLLSSGFVVVLFALGYMAGVDQ